MPKSKTIEIDEIVTPSDASSAKADRPRSADGGTTSTPTPEDPFAGFRKSLGWKTRTTLWITQKFLFLKSKSWGKWVIGPIVILAVMLAIPLGLIFATLLIIRSIFLSFRAPR